MRIFIALLLLFLASEANASELAFRVLRGAAASIPDGNIYQIRTKWLSGGSLEVRTWTTETAHSSVLDSPASLHAIDPETIYLTYREEKEAEDPDAPVVFCESVVELVFTISGLRRAGYKIIVESAYPLKAVRAEG